MRLKPKPYVGITGVTSGDHCWKLLNALPNKPSHLLMLGLLASSKTIHGEPNKWPCRYPKRNEMGAIFLQHQFALSLVHFNTKEPENLLSDMLLAQSLAGPYCDGFQLNLAWPDLGILEAYRSHGRFRDDKKKIVLQCGAHALDSVGRSGKMLAKRVREYADRDLIDYVLVDPSGGFGEEFDVKLALDCFNHLCQIETIGMGIAGGLCTSTIRRLDPLCKIWSDFSIDAEGRLRDPDDNLDMGNAISYIGSFLETIQDNRW